MPTGVAFTSISAESSNTCAISSIGRAYCWGENEYGQLGDGTTTNRLIPTAVRMPTRVTFTSIITGSIHTCALSTVKKAYCWGWNGDTNSGGQLGDGTNINRLIPTAVRMPLNTSFAAVGVGNTHSCAISSTRNAYCWGNNYSGQLGNNTVDDRIIPSIVAMPARTSFTTIALGDGHTCSLTNTGKAYCWGSNSYGQLGAYTDNYDPYNPTRLCWSCSTKPIVVNTY
jgi:alpha-tubulin suppressor-like RCC1 family protein